MILECGNCGAPLDVREGVSIMKCRYCGRTNERQRMRTIAAQTPPDFRPPRQWVPPAHVPAPSNKPLKYHSATATPIVLVIAALIGAAMLGSLVRGILRATGHAPPNIGKVIAGGATSQMVTALNLGQTPDGIAKALNGRPSDTSVYVPLADPRFEYVSFTWERGHLEHPTGFHFGVRSNYKADPQIEEALAKKLHGGFDNGNWRWYGGSSLNVQKGSGAVHANVRLKISVRGVDNAKWKEQLDALWKITLGALFDASIKISERDAWELLGAPHPFADLSSIDPQMSVDTVSGTIPTRIPGAMAIPSVRGLEVNISVDHPMFLTSELSWKNAKNGTLESARFSASPAFVSRRVALVECLKGKLGAPKERETDHLNKKVDYDFLVGTTWVRVYQTYVWVSPQGFKPLPAADWKRIVGAVDACR